MSFKMHSLKYLFVKNICFSFYCEEMRVFLTNLFVNGMYVALRQWASVF